MRFFQVLTNEKNKDAFITVFLFIATIVLASLGLWEQYSFFVYIFPIPLYFLIRRLSVWSAIFFGFNFGLYLSIPTYLWITRFEKFDPFILALVLYAFSFAIIFGVSNFIIIKYEKNLFIQIFTFGLIFYLARFILHFSGFANTFLVISNAPTVYDWVYPFFGAAVVQALILNTGFFIGYVIDGFLHNKDLQKIGNFVIFFVAIAIVIPMLSTYRAEKTEETVNIEAIQANANYSWAERVSRVEENFQYYLQETKDAASRGAKIVVWPEYAIPINIVNKNTHFVKDLESASRELDVVIVLGSIEDIAPQDGQNGAFIGYDLSLVFDPDQGMLEPYRAFHPYSSNILAGPKPKIFKTKYGNFPVLSCFEIAFHNFVANYFNMGEDVDFIIAIANNQVFDGTYGYTRLKYNAQSVAAENNRYLLYVTNTGPTVIFDNKGIIVAQVPYSQQGSTGFDVEKIRTKSLYSQFQEIIPLALIGGLFFWVLARERRKK